MLQQERNSTRSLNIIMVTRYQSGVIEFAGCCNVTNRAPRQNARLANSVLDPRYILVSDAIADPACAQRPDCSNRTQVTIIPMNFDD